jgi:hypothetical protein
MLEIAIIEPSTDSLPPIAKQAFLRESKYADRPTAAGRLELLADPRAYRARMFILWRRYREVRLEEAAEVDPAVWEEGIDERSLFLS